MIDLSLRALFAHASGRPYAITTTFDGRDLINGGMHMAVDVGNLGMDDPIKAVSRRGRGLYHYDGAIGYEDDLGNGWTLQRWHLNSTWAAGLSLIPGRSDVGDWADFQVGQTVGRTGNTGALVNGRPMPAHTHIELEKGGVRYDVAPFLLGRPFDPNQEDDMKLPADASYFATGKVGPGNRLRLDHRTTDGSEETKAVIDVELIGIVVNGTPYTLLDGRKGDRWYVVRRSSDGEVRQVAHLLVTSITPTPTLFSQIPLPAPPAADCSAQDNKLRGGRTAIAGALQAHEAAGRALEAAKEAIT